MIHNNEHQWKEQMEHDIADRNKISFSMLFKCVGKLTLSRQTNPHIIQVLDENKIRPHTIRVEKNHAR